MSDAATPGAGGLRERTAEEVRALLARRKMSATQLAKQMGISQAYIWRRLSGETAFDLDDLEKISVILSVEVTDLLPVRRPVVVSAGTHGQTTVPNVRIPHPGRPSSPMSRTVPKQSSRRPARLEPMGAETMPDLLVAELM